MKREAAGPAPPGNCRIDRSRLFRRVGEHTVPVFTGRIIAIDRDSVEINLVEKALGVGAIQVEKVELGLVPLLGAKVHQRFFIGG